MINKSLSVYLVTLLGLTACENSTETTAFVEQDEVTILKTLDSLAASDNKASEALLLEDLEALSQSDDEKKIVLTYDYYFRLEKANTVDSLISSAIKKFPRGTQARFKAYQNMLSAVDTVDRDDKVVNYDSWIAKFPPEEYAFSEQNIYNIALYYLLEKSVEENNSETTKQLLKRFLDHPSQVTSLYNMAGLYTTKEQKDIAKIYLEKAINSAEEWEKDTSIPKESLEEVKYIHNDALRLYAILLVESESCKEALEYFEKYKKRIDYLDSEANLQYADCLEASGNEAEAFKQLEEIVKAHNEYYDDTYPRLKKLFLATQGNKHDLLSYEENLQKEFEAHLKEQISSQIISEEAPFFKLTDLKGNEVSLADFKGKTLILDFWATWCKPCISSFPAMQEVKNTYKNNDEVLFLFVNTMENKTAEALVPRIEKLMQTRGYKFDVYLDQVSESKADETAAKFGITKIPYKIIIDASGVIRYRIIGFEGNTKAEKDKILLMIKNVLENS